MKETVISFKCQYKLRGQDKRSVFLWSFKIPRVKLSANSLDAHFYSKESFKFLAVDVEQNIVF